MSQLLWVLLVIGIFMLGQFMMMRPSAREAALMRLRESARKYGIQPRLVSSPSWLKSRHPGLIACYTLIIPSAQMPYWRAEQVEGVLKTVTPGHDMLAGHDLPAAAGLMLAIEAQANAVSFYWLENAGEDVLGEIKTFLQRLSAADLSSAFDG